MCMHGLGDPFLTTDCVMFGISNDFRNVFTQYFQLDLVHTNRTTGQILIS